MITQEVSKDVSVIAHQHNQFESIAPVEQPISPVVQVAQAALAQEEESQVRGIKRDVSVLTSTVEESASKTRRLEDDKKVATKVSGKEVHDEDKQQFEALRTELLAKLELWHEAMSACLSGITLFLHRKILNSDVDALKKETKEVKNLDEFEEMLVKYRKKLIAKGKFLSGKEAKGELSKGLVILDDMLQVISET